MRQDHAYRIEGYVNSRAIDGTGRGIVDTETGTSEMDVTFDRMAAGWDPRTIVLMCCDRALVMAARETEGTVGIHRASGGYLTIGGDLPGSGRESIMHTGTGELMAHVRAISTTDFRTSDAYDHSRVEGGVSHLRRGENGIAHIPAFDGIMMQAGPGLVVITTRYRAELENGSTLYGSTSYPHYLPEQTVEVPSYQILRVESVEQELIGNRLRSRVTTSILPLAPPTTETAEGAAERLVALG
ncbi:hypothetical protein [Actinopolyspora mortivallis]|uniref:Uncharacterized protein n=1 Tax=Actinopolyspora mortivallis TaxID=33906 RepID=A0A2T0GVH6_ACTMO|nr:hypothetical protein [Actinopolyspora mortivallis]PRW63104.1 hypothetical protein CEP50_11770 [Actinopolyspora mortivallis]